MDRRIRLWSMGGIPLAGAAAAAWILFNAPGRMKFPAATKAASAAPGVVSSPVVESPASVPTHTKSSHEGKTGDAAPVALRALPAGESLEFTAHVSKLSNVASLRVLVADRRSFLGRPVWHLQAFAHTQNPLRMVFALDDQFDSYSDAATLASLQYELHLNERGQKVDSILRMTTGKEPPPADATAARVLPGTRDPLGLLQFLRTVDWPKTPELRCPVFDGHKLYEVLVKPSGTSESVSVPAGDFSATKVEVQVFHEGAEVKDAHFSLYLANTAARTPVLLEAVLPFATARVELLRSQ